MCEVPSRDTIPPDGGYGWVVVFACAIKKVIMIPIVLNFGLVLQNSFKETTMLPAEGNQVNVWRATVEMLLSLFGGPLLQRFGYRKVAVVGSLLAFIAFVLTSTANSYWHFLFYYTILLSIGEAGAVPAFDLALNSYFKEKRTRAVGIVTFCAGLGPVFMPLLITYLLDLYGWRYTTLTLGAISLHCVLGACLLRPIKWYAKVPSEICEETNKLYKNPPLDTSLTNSGNQPAIQCNASENRPRLGSTGCLSGKVLLKNKASGLPHQITSCPNIFNNFQEVLLLQPLNTRTSKDETNNVKGKVKTQNNKSILKRNIYKIIDFFDLTILKDPVFVNILCGLCIEPCIAVNFSLMLPIILEDMLKLETSDIATLMSIIAFSDLLFRLVGPYITEPWIKSPRVIYMVSLLASIVARTAMIFTKTFNGLIYIAIALGTAKGIRATYVKVIIPDYVPIRRLGYALALLRFFRGITIFAFEEITMSLRQRTASYQIPIVILNILTFITIVMWTVEILYRRTRTHIRKEEISHNS